MMKDDLSTLSTEVIFYNWNQKTAGVICRLEPKARDNFFKGKSIKSVLDNFLTSVTKSQTTLVI